MAKCPQCRRPIARIQPRCLYCGAALAAELLAEAEATAAAALQANEPARTLDPAAPRVDTEPSPDQPTRSLLILDLRDADPKAVAATLGVSLFEANQRVKRGGYQLHRIAPDAQAARDADSLAAGGLRVLRIPETDALAEPVLIRGGRFEPERARLRTPGGPLQIEPRGLLLAVRGPIVREYQTPQDWRRLRSASLTQGYRFHLHRRTDPRPLELDPEAFDFDERETASSLLRISAWVEAIGVPIDDAFRTLPAALGEADPEARGGIDAKALGLRAPDPKDKAHKTILDNLRQFRSYSAWRGRVERLERPASG